MAQQSDRWLGSARVGVCAIVGASACVLAGALAVAPTAAYGQTPITRGAAIAAAVSRGPRAAVARADSASAAAAVAVARQYDNPVFGASFTQSTPQTHYSLDIPLDAPWQRTPRIGAARAGLDAATRRFTFIAASLAYEADTSYTRALAVTRRAELSQRNARDADSLLVLARLRRDAGDASELDVQLATVFAGQLANASAVDSLDAVVSRLNVQVVMGLPATQLSITLTDTLALDPKIASTGANSSTGVPLQIDVAEQELRAADLTLLFERRRRFPSPSFSLGVEGSNPGGPGGGLPTVGLSIPLPLFNQNGAAIRVAQATQQRSAALLVQARLEVAATLSQAERNARLARERAERSARLVAGADQIAALSLLAYREGASTLPNVLEAQRTARATLSQYIDDVSAARNAAGLVRLLSLTAASTP